MRPVTLLLLAALATTSCGGSSDPAALTDSGYRALATGDHASAAADFERALAGLDAQAGGDAYSRAKLGAIKATTSSDPSRATADFLAFAAAHPTEVTDSDYHEIAGRLGEAGHLEQAIALLEAGKAAYPESTHLDALGTKLVQQASKSGDSGALDALKGLGYVGD